MIHCQVIPIINPKPRLATLKPAAQIQRCIISNKAKESCLQAANFFCIR
jgi:hypothetical protein